MSLCQKKKHGKKKKRKKEKNKLSFRESAISQTLSLIIVAIICNFFSIIDDSITLMLS